MIAIAVNYFVTEARRKDVPGVIGFRSCRLAVPYPLLCTTLPFRITNTAAPGAPPTFQGAINASTLADRSTPQAKEARAAAAIIPRTSMSQEYCHEDPKAKEPPRNDPCNRVARNPEVEAYGSRSKDAVLVHNRNL